MANIQQIIKDSKFIPEIKEALFEDCFAHLEGAFGLSKKGVFEAISRLPNIKEGTQDYVIRKELEHFIKRKQESDISPQEAVRDFVREYAFTCVNRFVAFKMMEERWPAHGREGLPIKKMKNYGNKARSMNHTRILSSGNARNFVMTMKSKSCLIQVTLLAIFSLKKER